jgi:hypothetical protein
MALAAQVLNHSLAKAESHLHYSSFYDVLPKVKERISHFIKNRKFSTFVC